MSSGLISQEDEGTTSGRLDAPLYCLGAGQLLQHELSIHMQLHAHTRCTHQDESAEGEGCDRGRSSKREAQDMVAAKCLGLH